MKLFTLLYGRSKKRMRPIMTDEFRRVDNYRNARENSGVKGWHQIVAAEPGAVQWRQKSATIGGNKPIVVSRIGKGRPGYISKNGFREHT